MRILFTCHPSESHLRTLVPIAHTARARGHQVLFAVPREFCGRVALYRLDSTGIEPPADSHGDGDRLQDAVKRYGLGPELLRHISSREHRIGLVADYAGSGCMTHTVKELLALIDRWLPDLVIRESSEFGGYLAAELRSLPHVSVAVGCASANFLRCESVYAALNRQRARLDLADDPFGERLYPLRHVVLMPKEYDEAETEWPSSVRVYRHTDAQVPGEQVPGWVTDIPASPPMVLVSFGSRAERIHGEAYFRSLLGSIVAALRRVDCYGVIAAGSAFGTSWSVGNLRSESRVPQPLLLQAADLLISHGGFASVREAAAAGTPMILIPLTEDGPANATAAANAGIAETVLAEDANLEAISDSVTRVLSGSLLEGSRRMQRAILASPPPDVLIDELSQLV